MDERYLMKAVFRTSHNGVTTISEINPSNGQNCKAFTTSSLEVARLISKRDVRLAR